MPHSQVGCPLFTPSAHNDMYLPSCGGPSGIVRGVVPVVDMGVLVPQLKERSTRRGTAIEIERLVIRRSPSLVLDTVARSFAKGPILHCGMNRLPRSQAVTWIRSHNLFGAISAPFGQTIVPKSGFTRTCLKYSRSRSGSNTGPSNEREIPASPCVPSSNLIQTVHSRT